MAYAEVGSGSQRASRFDDNVTASDPLAFPANVTAGSLLIAGGGIYGGSALPTSILITDTRSTSYTVFIGTVTAGHQCHYVAYGIAPSGGANSVTVSPNTTGNYITVAIDEFANSHATPFDVDSGQSSGFGEPSFSITPTVDNALLIGIAAFSDGISIVMDPGSGYTQIGEEQDNGAHACYNLVFRIVTTAQAYTVNWEYGTSASWFAQAWAFKPAVGAPDVAGSGVRVLGVYSPRATTQPVARGWA